MLDKPTLKTEILQLLTDMESRVTDSKAEFATRLSDAIEAFVKSGTVTTTVAAGIAVATAGSATAQTGATTATGSGTGQIN